MLLAAWPPGPALTRRLMMLLLATAVLQRAVVAAAAAASSAAAPPMIVQVVADDLGYNDLGFTNNGKTHTPNIDEAVGNGVLLTAYHTYKVCSPTRASLM
jgi:arylsulfatase A